MGKTFWDTVDEPCLAFSFSWGGEEKKEEKIDHDEIKLLRQEVKELKKLASMKKVEAIEGDYRLIE